MTVSPEEQFDAAPDIIHYTEFWYSARPPGVADSDLIGDPKDAVARHVRNLRVLSIFFEKIFFSRSHLLTHLDEASREIVEKTLSTPEVAALSERGIVQTAARPGMDGAADTQRIIERARRLKIGITSEHTTIEHIVSKLPVISADSRPESQATLELYKDIAGKLRRRSPSLAIEFEELLQLSETPDAPFLHEIFLSYLNATTFSESLKQKIWQKTNSIYLKGGATFSDSSMDYHHLGYENEDNIFFRGIDRRTYRPEVLLQYLIYLTSSHEIGTLLKMPVEKFLFFRVDGNKANGLWPDFRSEYFDLASDVSEVSYLAWSDVQIHENRIFEILIAALEGRITGYAGDIAGAVAQIAKVTAQTLDPTIGVGTEIAARGGQAILKSGVGRFVLRLKRPRTFRFVSLLKEIAKANR